MQEIVSRVLAHDVRATARLCRMVDERSPAYASLLAELCRQARPAWWIGVTGNPGAGKSSLIAALIGALRRDGQRVGVVAVDPTSPFSGGALLGDRIRMQAHTGDAGVFIRSLATRGALGGLSWSTVDIARVLEGWGADVVIVETVGVGQDEVDVARAVHTTIVVVAPGLGDEVQANKAGLLECADLFAVNKADRPGADAAVSDLELMLALTNHGPVTAGHGAHALHARAKPAEGSEAALDPALPWIPPIVRTVATQDVGTLELLSKARLHQRWLEQGELGKARRLARVRQQLVLALREAWLDSALIRLGPSLDALASAVEERRVDPYDAREQLLRLLGTSAGPDTHV